MIQRSDRRQRGGTPENVNIVTLSGATITVSRDEIVSIKRRRLVLEEYESLRRQAPDTVDGQWELAEWCAARRLLTQRRTHLERVVELDPLHEAAHRGLGHQNYDGQWMSREDYMKSQGQVLYRGRYVFPQELDQIEQDRQAKESEREWHKKTKMWHTWLTSDRPDLQKKAVAELTAITDPLAIPALAKRFGSDRRPPLRELYVSILSGMRGPAALEALVAQAVLDVQPHIRTAAVAAIPEQQRDDAIRAFVRGLRNEQNLIVGRSATALAQLGNEQVVPDLIDALITTHNYRVVVPDSGSNTIGFAANGGPAPIVSGLPPNVELQLMTGQLPYGAVMVSPEDPAAEMRKTTKVVKRTQKNPAVLQALKSLTDQDFSYNRSKWRLWWAEKNNNVGKT